MYHLLKLIVSKIRKARPSRSNPDAIKGLEKQKAWALHKSGYPLTPEQRKLLRLPD